MVDIVSFVGKKLHEAGVPYEYGEWTGNISYPYFVGSFMETESYFEDGQTVGIFTIDGWSRGSKVKLLEMVDKIKATFRSLYEAVDGTLFFVVYSGALPAPTGENDLSKVTITLNTNEWKGNGD